MAVFIDLAIAVIVQLVAASFELLAFQRFAHLLAAILAVRHFVPAYAHSTGRAAKLLVDKGVAVVVDSIAGLRFCTLLRIALPFLTVDARGCLVVTGANAAGDGGLGFIDLTIAIIIEPVADLPLR